MATQQQEQDQSATTDAGEGQQLTEKPEVTDEHRAVAKEMAKAYEDDRPTIGLPGTSNTVAGQAVGEWVDEDGNPKFGEAANVKHEDVMGERHESMSDSDDFTEGDDSKKDDSQS